MNYKNYILYKKKFLKFTQKYTIKLIFIIKEINKKQKKKKNEIEINKIKHQKRLHAFKKIIVTNSEYSRVSGYCTPIII